MKKLLFFITILFCFQKSIAQKISFSDTTNVWRYISDTYNGSPCYIGCGGSTNYHGVTKRNGLTYQIIDISDTTLIREDKANDKVYVKFTRTGGLNKDTFEHVLYDYNLVVGDTFKYIVDTNSVFIHVVSMMDTVYIGGVAHRIWQFLPINGWGYFVIEGIGATKQPLYPAFPDYFVIDPNLYCFSNQGNTPLISPAVTWYRFKRFNSSGTLGSYQGQFDNVNSCSLPTSVNETPLYNQLKVYPQPSEGDVLVEFTSVIDADIYLTDILGRPILHKPVRHQSSVVIERNNIPKGIYYLKLTNLAKQVSYTSKIVFN